MKGHIMDFTKFSDLGYFDGLFYKEGLPFLVVFLIALGAVIFVFAHSGIDFKSGEGVTMLMCCAIMVAFLAVNANSSAFHAMEVETQKDNIRQVFNIPEGGFEDVSVAQDLLIFDTGEGFHDLKATIKDEGKEALYEVTFGFKDSGEPFVYDRSEAVEFVEGLKK